MSCEYCKNELNPYSSYYKVGFAIRDNSILVYKNVGNDISEILLEKDIKYCPFCGDGLPELPQITLGNKADLWNKKEAEIEKPKESIIDSYRKQQNCDHDFQPDHTDRLVEELGLKKKVCTKCGKQVIY